MNYGANMRLSQIWTYPVKSMVGETISSCELNDLGIVGDRIWATRDLERGGIRGAKKIGALMQFSAERVDPALRTVKITAPNGESFLTNEADSSEKLSSLLGHRVVLEELPDASDVEHFRRGPSVCQRLPRLDERYSNQYKYISTRRFSSALSGAKVAKSPT